jgi:predicted dehydrogenase/threonine dehydrogenase-like Zn-dependent dehydrogenase
VLIRVAYTCVSPGTERSAVDFAKKNLLQKAQARPDLVAQVIRKARNDGLGAACKAALSRLEQPLALGYSASGTVIEIAEGSAQTVIPYRAAAAGTGYASHAEFIVVPANLVVPVPDSVDLESASFVALGSIALHGVRLAQPQIGECVAVIGLGIVGQITLQILKAAGCRVVGTDLKKERVEIARPYGDAVTADKSEFDAAVRRFSSGRGADVVIIAADSTTAAPVELAAEVARDRGTVVAVGAVATHLPRRAYYDKELSFRVSRSYGPGRYDPTYEEKGQEYPYAYVRWTERRNMQAFLDLVAQKKIDITALITHRFSIDHAPKAYELIAGGSPESSLGVVLTYPEQSPAPTPSLLIQQHDTAPSAAVLHVSLLGAGTFARSVLIPSIKEIPELKVQGVATATGITAASVAKKFGFAFSTTNAQEILNDPATNVVVIATRHHLHAVQVIQSLAAGKHVFVEKPLCITREELREISEAYCGVRRRLILGTGYNRRFAACVRKVKSFRLAVKEPLLMTYRINAGFLRNDHWIQDSAEGGGRIVGEVCHFVDLLTYITGELPTRVTARALPNGEKYSSDNLAIVLEFADGSIGTIHYCANGDSAFPKERLEIFGGGTTAVIEDFKVLQIVRDGKSTITRWRLAKDKGHRREWQEFARALKEGREPIPYEEIVAGMLATFAVVSSLRTQGTVNVDTDAFMRQLRF